MNTKEAERRWTRSSEKPIRYGWLARLGDWWCASRDARKGLPQLPEDDGSRPDDDIPTGTPHMSFLGQQGVERISKEWIVFQAEVAEPMARRSDLEARVKALRDELAAAEQQFQALENTSVGTQAVAGEDRTDPGIIAQRREKEHSRRRDKVKSTIDGLTSEINKLMVEVARISEQVEIRRWIAMRRREMIEAHIRRRRAAYETRLVRKHPQGLFLNRLLKPGWPTNPDVPLVGAAAGWNGPPSPRGPEPDLALSAGGHSKAETGLARPAGGDR